MDVNPTAVLLLQSLIFLLQPPKPVPAGPPSPASRGRLCCHVGLTAPPYSHRWPGHPSTHPHPSTAVASPPPGHSLPGSRRRPSRWCSRSTLSTNDNIGRGMYMERLTVGTHMVHGRTQASTLYYAKKMNPPHDSWDPPAISWHGRKCLLIKRKITIAPHDSWGPLDLEADLWPY